MFLVTACPYTSSVPIGPADEEINKTLLGKWISGTDIEYEFPTYYSISKADKTKYNVVEFMYSSYDSTYSETAYTMHSTTIGDNVFMNVQEKTGGDYHLHKIEVAKNEFILHEVSDNIDEKFSSSNELKTFIEKNMNYSFFYNKGEKKYYKK